MIFIYIIIIIIFIFMINISIKKRNNQFGTRLGEKNIRKKKETEKKCFGLKALSLGRLFSSNCYATDLNQSNTYLLPPSRL